MVRKMEAVFERGVLRPLEPLALEESQHVLITVTDIPDEPYPNMRIAEQEWLARHGKEYAGEWVALQGSELISHGPKALEVRDEARRKGVDLPLMVQVPVEPDMPSAGWL